MKKNSVIIFFYISIDKCEILNKNTYIHRGKDFEQHDPAE